MRRISHQDFTEEFPMMVPGSVIRGIQPGIDITSDCLVSGIYKGDVTLRPGAKVLIHGIVEGNLIVEKGAVLYLIGGIVKGNLKVAGAANVHGIVGNLKAEDDAVIALDGIVEKQGGSAA
jgi:hypothetical protein